MAAPGRKLTAAVEEYLAELRRIRATGGGTGELSYYPPLNNLLNAVGGSLRPRVYCVSQLAQQGAEHPDFGLYAARHVSKGQPKQGQLPEGGVVEVKTASDDAWLTAHSAQVSRYWERYRLALVTNTRDFVLLGEDSQGNPAKLKTLRLADFEAKLQHPRAFANSVGPALAEYLGRALSHRATLAEPRDLARLLASYARDGLARVEASGDASSLNAVRSALEEALGVKFEGERGAALFRSTLVQTLFYGVFSAWVLWARQPPPPGELFNWHETPWLLRVPILEALFRQVASREQLQSLDLVEVLDWTAAALDRVNRETFFARFNEGEAVPYFYEPFLEAFDPALRKQLGVWYTPAEVVRYMVARVDCALKDDLGIEDGLAAENVYVLDPCCGTGAYLAETLKRIAANLRGRGLGALTGARVKQAATKRVFGFEIMPAPFVVAHLQVGLTMQALDAPLSEDGNERAGVFLTNALTGWEPRTQKPLPFPELEEERDRAERVKQDTPVLVIMGNPPYNGFAGMAVDEERELSKAYRTTKQVRKPEGQGLNDLYVRFFRMAEAAHRGEDRAGRRLLHLQLLLAGRAVLHRNAGAIPGGFRRHPHRLSQRRQVQDGKDHTRRFAGPQHLLHAGGPGGHPGGHRHRHPGQEGGTRARRVRGLPPPVGADQADETDRHGGSGTGSALRNRRAAAAVGPALRFGGGQPGLERIAVTAGPVPQIVSRSQDQPRFFPHRR